MTEVRTLTGDTPVEDHGYRPAPPGLRANMIFSADGAAAFAGRAGPLSCPADYGLLLALRAPKATDRYGFGPPTASSAARWGSASNRHPSPSSPAVGACPRACSTARSGPS